MLQLPGESRGAGQDVTITRERGIPIYYDIDDVPGMRPC